MNTTICSHGGCECTVDARAGHDAATDSAEGAAYCCDYCADASEDTQDGECACGHPPCDV